MIKSNVIRLASGRFDMIEQEQQQQQSPSNNNNNTNDSEASSSLDNDEDDLFFDAHCHLPSSSSFDDAASSDHDHDNEQHSNNTSQDLTLSNSSLLSSFTIRENSIRLDRITRTSSIIRRNHTFDKQDQTTLDGSARTADTTSSRSSCSRVRFAPDVVTEVWKCIQEHDSLSDDHKEKGGATHQHPKDSCSSSSCSVHSCNSHTRKSPMRRQLLRSFSESQISFVAHGHKQQQCSNKRSSATSSAVKFLSTPMSFMKKTSQKKVSMYY